MAERRTGTGIYMFSTDSCGLLCKITELPHTSPKLSPLDTDACNLAFTDLLMNPDHKPDIKLTHFTAQNHHPCKKSV